MSSLNLGPAFDADLITLAGWDPSVVDTGTISVALVNPTGGPTTVRAEITASVPTDALKALISQYSCTATADTDTPAPDTAP